jgi:hypothetical protein
VFGGKAKADVGEALLLSGGSMVDNESLDRFAFGKIEAVMTSGVAQCTGTRCENRRTGGDNRRRDYNHRPQQPHRYLSA